MKISFLILTWNRHKFLDKCLETLIPAIDNTKDCEIIVMNNGSTDETSAVLDKYKHHPMLRIIHRRKNRGLKAYKRLFLYAKGDHMVVVDDDVLSFPRHLDTIFIDYMKSFPDFGFVGLNVVQNEFTNGAKPGPEHYTDVVMNDKVIQQGPTGGWCTCFRKQDFKKIRLKFLLADLSMKNGEDGFLSLCFEQKLGLKSGIIKDAVCFHASGPHYAKLYGHLEREIEKYASAELDDFVKVYREYESAEL